MSDYRINVRFHDDNEEERRAAEYLKTLHRSRNQFVVDAVLARMNNTRMVPAGMYICATLMNGLEATVCLPMREFPSFFHRYRMR